MAQIRIIVAKLPLRSSGSLAALSRIRCRNVQTSYQQLQPEERLTVANLHLQGSSMRAMAAYSGTHRQLSAVS